MFATVVPHDPDWTRAFAEEAAEIYAAAGPSAMTLHHIGSTAIPGILAKPIIDLLGVVSNLAVAEAQAGALERLGYEAMGAFGIEGRNYFRKTNAIGTRTHHLHVFAEGSPHIERHIAFRDYLIAHSEMAAEYSALKAALTQGADVSWNTYMDGKDPFINRVEAEALDWSRSRNRTRF